MDNIASSSGGSGNGNRNGNGSGIPSRRPLIHIPSFSEVMNSTKPLPPSNLFRASTSSPPSGPTFRPSLHVPQPSLPPQIPIPAIPKPPNHGSQGQTFATNINNIHIPGLSPSQLRNAIIVGKRQQGNPVLKHIRNVRWVFGDVVPDYLLGTSTCALYLSLRYHLLHPDYLYFRIRELQKSYRLRVVLCHVDVEDVIKPLHDVTKTALLNDCTLFCAWSVEECARYLETLKVYENKPSDNIQERIDNDYLSRLTSALTTVRHVNKTDVLTLGTNFGSLSGVIGASMEELAQCPGIGERKVKRLYDAFHEPFRRTTKQAKLDTMGILPTNAVDSNPEVGEEVEKEEGRETIGNGREKNGESQITTDSRRENQLKGSHGTSAKSVRVALDAAKERRELLQHSEKSNFRNLYTEVNLVSLKF